MAVSWLDVFQKAYGATDLSQTLMRVSLFYSYAERERVPPLFMMVQGKHKQVTKPQEIDHTPGHASKLFVSPMWSTNEPQP